ncbi:MAG: TetR/AcrR family transcriptional regulator, partial [Candidatus Heimdallarchaeota archaeon]|nr:TetR/AcrR family transcriptional regulator [Candidatus Heimdallarchaeota archaeon]
MSNNVSDAKKHILNTSIQLFSSQGYKETSIRKISKEAGVNVSMISYYFSGKDGILREIVKDIADGFSSLLSQFDLNDMSVTMDILKRLLRYVENHRPQIKILFFEMGKRNDYLTPVKKEIKELQTKLGILILSKNNTSNISELERKLKIMTDIMLGMIFSDYILD